MMKLIEKLTEQLKTIGATVEDNGYSLYLVAPGGYVWSANSMTSYTIQYGTNSQTWLAEALRVEMPNVRMGCEKVTDPEEIEEIRYNLGEDDWGSSDEAPMRLEVK